MDEILIENPNIRKDWEARRANVMTMQITAIPGGVTPGVPPETYNAYRQGRDSACIDMVLCTRNGHKPAALLSLRSSTVCYANKWWIYGGALAAYQPIPEFIAGRAQKECGVRVEPEVLLGVYRTCASDYIGSTLQACYAARVDYDIAYAKMRTDDAHQSVKLFDLDELNAIPEAQQHWYPLRVARLALEHMP